MITGACFCGRVTYRVAGALTDARSCHCSRCRRLFGGAASAYAEVAADDFNWTGGADLVHSYGDPKGWEMLFCSRCSSALCGRFGGQVHGVVLGTVDGDPGIVLERHLFVGSKAVWDSIGGDAPQFETDGS